MFNNFMMDKSLYITDERAPESSIPKGAEKAGQYTCDRGSSVRTKWRVPPVASCHLGFFFFLNQNLGQFRF